MVVQMKGRKTASEQSITQPIKQAVLEAAKAAIMAVTEAETQPNLQDQPQQYQKLVVVQY